MRVLSASQWSMLQNVANRKVVVGPTGKTVGWLAYGISAPDYWMPFTESDYTDFLELRAADLVTDRAELTEAGAAWISSK